MTNELTKRQDAHLAPINGELTEAAKTFMKQAKAAQTKRNYSTDWDDFTSWAEEHNVMALPATDAAVANYIADRARTHKVATIKRRLAAIAQAHQLARQYDPTKSKTVRTVLAGIRRAKPGDQEGAKAVTTEHIKTWLAGLDDSKRSARNKALVLVGFAGALRRSELVGLDVDDLQFTARGVVLAIGQSKTDQEGQGQYVAVEYGENDGTCPVLALQRWLAAAGITSGPVFRRVNKWDAVLDGRLTDQTVALVVKELCQAIGIDDSRCSGHSLRAGHVTQARSGGADKHSIQQQGRWRNSGMVDRYTRIEDAFERGSSKYLGL